MAKRVTKKRSIKLFVIAIFVALVGIVLGCLYIKTKTPPPVTTSAAFSTLMTGMTIAVPDTNFTVHMSAETGKTVEYGDFPNNPQDGYGTVTILPTFVAAFDKNQYIAIVAINSGGSGEMFYLAAFERRANGYFMTSAKQLGDRIQMKEIAVQNGRIYVFYMDHGPTQAMVDAPNTPVKKQFVYKDQQLLDVLR